MSPSFRPSVRLSDMLLATFARGEGISDRYNSRFKQMAKRCRRSRRGFEPHSAQLYFIFLPIHFFSGSCISNDPGPLLKFI